MAKEERQEMDQPARGTRPSLAEEQRLAFEQDRLRRAAERAHSPVPTAYIFRN